MKKCTFLLLICLSCISTSHLFCQHNQIGVVQLGIPPDIYAPDIMRLNRKSELVVDNNNQLWYSTDAWFPTEDIFFESWLVQYDLNEQTWQIFNSENTPFLPDTIYCLNVFDDKLFVGTSRGVAVYDGSWSFIEKNDELPDSHARKLLLTNESFYVGGNSGLSLFAEGVWNRYHTSNSGIVGDTIEALILDAEGHIWVGTTTGLSRYSSGSWTNYTSANSALQDNHITSLASNNENHLWIGTSGSGIYRLVNETIDPFSESHYLPLRPTAIKSISANAKGEVFTFLKTAAGKDISVKIENYGHQVYRYGAPGHYKFIDDIVYIGLTNSWGIQAYHLKEAELYDNLNYLDINNVLADFSASSSVAWENGLHERPRFEIPAGSGKNTLWNHNLWIGGLANGNDLHLSAERYRQVGREYWPGPVSFPYEVYQQEQEKWNRVWKIDRQTIDYHRANWWKSAYEIPEVIKNWPAHGDTTNGQEWYMAPYMDHNTNGIYEPQLGDYPVIRGDQALFFIFNDIRHENTESQGVPLGIEVRAMAYGFNAPENEALHNSVFVNYQIVNRSGTTYDSLYAGFLTDFEIGYGWDDYIGSDTLLNSYFGYNGYAVDGSGEPDSYGASPPAQAVTFLNQPLSSLIYVMPDPSMPEYNAHNYYNNLRGRWPNGKPMVWGGYGFPGGPGTTDEVVSHMFPDDPNSAEGWHEVAVGFDPGNRRGISSAFIGQFEPGEKICFDIAFVFGRDMEGDHLSSVSVMKANIEQIKEFYDEFIADDCLDLTATDVGETTANPNTGLKLRPNPTSGQLSIVYKPEAPDTYYNIFNALGTNAQGGAISSSETTIDVSHLPAGIYIFVIYDGRKALRQKMIKQ